MHCPLCGDLAADHGLGPLRQTLWRCGRCDLVFVSPDQRPDIDRERTYYRLHQNRLDDPGYRAFLDRLATPLLARLRPGDRGLDFGCGSVPLLARMLAEQGHPTALYDPIHAPDAQVLTRCYRFITCTEVAEHFHAPGAEFRRLDAMLDPGGWFGLMTSLHDGRDLGRWHYARDPTHVVFYGRRTLAWLADRHGWRLERAGDTVALFRKPGGSMPVVPCEGGVNRRALP